jgi:SAM-dependent methyltransferase
MLTHTSILFLYKKIFGLEDNHMDQNEKTRIAWVEQALKQVPAGSLILDAGAGEQQYRKFCSHLSYVSQDFAAYKPEELDLGLQMPKWEYGQLDIISDIIAIPRPDQSFDAILCTEVLEHIPDPNAALHEFARLLKPGGMLILTAPFCSMTHFAPYHYCTGFSVYYYQKWMEELGFEIRELKNNGNYFSFIGQEINRLPYVIEQYLGKRPGWWLNLALRIVSSFLNKAKDRADSSSELLCFGWQLIAIKK